MQEEALSLLSCPLCRTALSRRGQSLICAQNHCFDLSRQGDVHLAPGKHESFYTKELFESRAQVFASGLYAPVVQALTKAMDVYVPHAHPVLADAGCGEGYYLRSVCPDRAMTRIGFDLCKEAVRLAARTDKTSSYLVADLRCIPLADNSCDAVLDIFTPANYAEFRRILRPGGVLIKLAPRAGYLVQLREAASPFLRRTQYDGDPVTRYAQEHMTLLEQQDITYTLPITAPLAAHIARMTPMLAGVDLAKLDLSGLTEITIDETLFIGTLNG